MEEIWKDIKVYEGVYQVSTLGRIRSLKDGKIKVPGRKRSKSKYKTYLGVGLNGSMFTVHRLVAETFIPDHPENAEVDHIDGDRYNNKLSNLRWLSHKENVAVARANQRLSKLISTINRSKAIEIQSLYKTKSRRAVMKKFGISEMELLEIAKRSVDIFNE